MIASFKTLVHIILALIMCPVVVAHGQPVVMLFGDSISYGFNLNFPHPSPTNGGSKLEFGQPSIQLTKILDGNKREGLVPNLGVGGSASGPSGDPDLFSNNGVDRIVNDLTVTRDLFDSGSKYLVLILYGTNDSAYSISPSTTGFNIQQMIDSADSLGITAVVGTIPPCACQSQSAVDSVNSYIKSAVNIKAGQGKDVHLVDHYTNLVNQGWYASLSDPDGVHPNDAGYLTIAQHWFDAALNEIIPPAMGNISPILDILLGDEE